VLSRSELIIWPVDQVSSLVHWVTICTPVLVITNTCTLYFLEHCLCCCLYTDRASEGVFFQLGSWMLCYRNEKIVFNIDWDHFKICHYTSNIFLKIWLLVTLENLIEIYYHNIYSNSLTIFKHKYFDCAVFLWLRHKFKMQ